MTSHHTHGRTDRRAGLEWLAFPLGAILLAPSAAASPLQGMERRFGGETRQVFELTDGGDSHVWTVGDGAHIRYALNPQGDDWTVQSPPADVTQTLLDVHFLDEDHGWACGVAGNVLSTSNGGATWSHFDSVQIPNELDEPAVLWRVRFTDTVVTTQQPVDPLGFTCGLWTFKYWDGTGWEDVLLDGGSTVTSEMEFYALDIVVDPANPSDWFGVAAGQKWSSPGGGSGKVGRIYYTSSRAADAGTWDYGRNWTLVHETYAHGAANLIIEDPWDFEFAPLGNNDLDDAVGYLSSGGNKAIYTHTTVGAVYRTQDGGQSWRVDLDKTLLPPGSEDVATLYGITAIDDDRAMAVGYGGQVWYRDSSGTWTEKVDNTACLSNPCDWTGPLAGTNAAADGTLYAVGSWGFVRSSMDDWDTVDDLNTHTYQSVLVPRSPEDWEEHWRFESLCFIDSDHGFAVGDKKAIAETDSGGNNFDRVLGGPPVSSQFLDVDFNDAGTTGVAVGSTSDPSLNGTLDLANALTYYYASGAWLPGAHPGSVATGTFASIELRGVACEPASDDVWAVGTAIEPPPKPVGYKRQNPLLLRSQDGGATWTNELPGAVIGNIPKGVLLNDVALGMVGPNLVGYCVGYDKDTNGARAYAFLDPGGTGLRIYDLSPASGGPLRAVATNGAIAYAVGNDELIVEYVPGSSSGFATSSAGSLLGGLDLVSAAITPNGVLLVGAEQEYEEPASVPMGKLIHFDGSTWGTLRAGTSKIVRSIYVGDDEAWLIGLGVNGDPEFGAVGDSVIEHLSGLE